MYYFIGIFHKKANYNMIKITRWNCLISITICACILYFMIYINLNPRTWNTNKNQNVVNLRNNENKHKSHDFHMCKEPRAPLAAAPLLHSIWHVLQLWGRKLYVVHGYLDERPNMDSGPSVRFITLSGNGTHMKMISEKVYCTFWLSNDTDRLSNNSIIHVSRAQVKGHPQRKMKPVNNITWINTYITCPIPDEIQLQLNDLKVSFSGIPCGNRTSPIPVLRIEKPKNFIAQVGKFSRYLRLFIYIMF